MSRGPLRSAIALCLLPSLLAPLALADAPPAAPAAPAASAPTGLDFDLMPTVERPADPVAEALKKKATEQLESKVRTRRRMLVMHQAFGFATLAVMAATLVVGQLNYDDKYGGGNDTGKFIPWHAGLGFATTALFATTGALALFAPNPYPKSTKFDTALVHKLAMIMATVGMVTQIVLGPIATAREGHLDQRNIILAHVISGYATFGFMVAGTVAYVF